MLVANIDVNNSVAEFDFVVVNDEGVVTNLHSQFIVGVQHEATVVLEGVALDDTAHFLRKRN